MIDQRTYVYTSFPNKPIWLKSEIYLKNAFHILFSRSVHESFRARLPSKSECWRCDKEALSLCCEISLLRDFFAERLLCCWISLLKDFFAVRSFCSETSLLWDLFAVRPLCCEISLLWDLIAVRSRCCEISLLWDLVAVRSRCWWVFFAVRLLCCEMNHFQRSVRRNFLWICFLAVCLVFYLTHGLIFHSTKHSQQLQLWRPKIPPNTISKHDRGNSRVENMTPAKILGKL